MKEVALYFGSFNPIHIGHLALANWLCEFCEIDELWFVVSPCNPFKRDRHLMDDKFRLHLVELAISGYEKFKVCDVELSMSQPSYTVNTIDKLRSTYPDYHFTIVMGADNWLSFPHWRDSERLLCENKIVIYRRPGYDTLETASLPPNVVVVDAPLLDVSSTFIRTSLKEGRDIRYFLHPSVSKALIDNFDSIATCL